MKRPYCKYPALSIASAVLTTFIFAASSPAAGPGPVPIPEECYCAGCGMRVPADDLFASQITPADGKTAFFCDLGDMFLYYDSHKADLQASAIFVRDYASGGWVDGKIAFYLTGAKVRTPMRYGILAFGDEGAAKKFRRESGGDKVLTFGEAVAGKVWEE